MIQPLNNRVLIKQNKKETTNSGIMLPDSEKEQVREGVVIDFAQEVTTVEKGQTVMFQSYYADRIEYEGVEYFLIDKGFVLAKKDA